MPSISGMRKEDYLYTSRALRKAPKWSYPLITLIAINCPIDRHVVDPVTGLHPFMSAASVRKSDLSVIYFLLRRDPNAQEGLGSISLM